MSWLFSRLHEPSTIMALFAIGSAFFGLDLTPDQQAAITMLAAAIFVSKG
ncbi:MAG: hypothetical protein PHD53_00045 [Methylococcales bacterium]|nr:hypothetical protein [Methylococcales bacterium]